MGAQLQGRSDGAALCAKSAKSTALIPRRSILMSLWPVCSADTVRWICLAGVVRFAGVVSRCGSYGLSPIVDEVHDVIFVDGIHLGRSAVVLIAQTSDHVLGWYAARSENSRAWGALMSRIAPPGPGHHRRGQRVCDSVQEHLAHHARSTLHLPRV